MYSVPLLKVFPLELGIGAWGKKKNKGRERSLTISSAIRIQYTNVTDGHTPADSQNCAYA